MNIGFIGLGHLGKAVATRLIECDHSVVVYNRSPEKAKGLKVEVVTSPAELLSKAEIIFLCLFDSAAVKEILTGDNGLLSAKDLNDKIIVDLTTNHHNEVTAFHDLCRSAGGDYLEAPVLGSVVPASQGTLTVLVSGRKVAYERVEEILQDIGSHIFYLETAAMATKMKLINNLVLGTFMATLAEATAMGETAGINKKDILEILSVGGGSSLVLNAKKTKLLEEDFSTHFSCSLIAKDLHCLLDLANSLEKPLFTGALVKQLYGRTFEENIAEEDFSAIYKVFKG